MAGNEGRVSEVTELIGQMRADAGPDMVPSRVEAEAQARALLNHAAGQMSAEQVHDLGRIVNEGSWGGTLKQARFVPAFTDPQINKVVADLGRLNEIVAEMWNGTEEQALETAGRVMADPTALSGAGRSFPSVILYIRNPERFAVWFDSVDRGLSRLSNYRAQGRATGRDGYLTYCEATQDFAREYELAPQEIDAVLASAGYAKEFGSAPATEQSPTPTITADAFAFLEGLREHDSYEWFNANRELYEQHVRDPLAAVFQVVADRYMVSLDPLLNTKVKRDQVLARINKYSANSIYYDYYWGAFSREKKQEDVQLFVNIHWSELRFGLYLGSASDEALERLATWLETNGVDLLDSILTKHPDLVFEPEEFAGPVSVRTAAEAAEWVRGKAPVLVRILKPTDPLVGSDRLANEIGSTLADLHQLAAIAWGDTPELDIPHLSDESSGPQYTMGSLLEDTLLPRSQLEEWIELLRGPKRAALLYGPPGTGKTHVAEKLAKHLSGSEGESQTVQFHPSFSYEDFIEGLRPTMENDHFGYEIRDGVFKEFCEQARGKDADYVFVIDEINRAELGSVLGEVMMLIEYRDRAIPLPYSQRPFSIPRNVILLATMNTADRSLALVDFALRRRFHALQMPPNRDVLAARLGEEGDLALAMFDLIQHHVDSDDYSPGHTYWMIDDTTSRGLKRLWDYELRPYLSEYWFENKNRLDELEKDVLALIGEGA